jgi:hypothetical protein
MRESAPGFLMVKITVTEEVPSQLCRGANIKGAPDWRREKMCTGPTSDEALDDDCKHRRETSV